ncbi:hypothetical protein BDV97DRAFT_150728 [Delphinella strobiligena]|nr:hypothetical protein BDV97DRAFT_150728 [Delphinella strobiligena]
MEYTKDGHGTFLVVFAWCFLVTSTLIVALRFWVRCTRIHRICLDDWFMLASLVSEYLHTILICVGYTYGLGRHIASLSDYNRMHAVKYIIMIQAFAITTSALGRTSFAIFLLQLVGPSKRWQKAFLWGVVTLQLVVTIPTLIQIYTQCGTHLSAMWDPAVAAHHSCDSPNIQTIIGFVQSGLNSLCDLVLTILPCFILWQLHMPIGTKIGLGAVLTLSIFAFGASIVKAVEIKNLGGRSDFTWAFMYLSIWVIVENNVVIYAATIPTLRPIMKRKHGSTASAYTHGGTKHRNPYNTYLSGGEDTSGNSRSGRRASDSTWLGRASTSCNEPSVQTVFTVAAGTDDNSEDYILQPLGDKQITKTTNVHIAWEEQDPGHHQGFDVGLDQASHGNATQDITPYHRHSR